MSSKVFLSYFVLFLFFFPLSGQENIESNDKSNLRWLINPKGGIYFDLEKEPALPYSDNIEMSGRKVSAILYYNIDSSRNLSLNREVFFPQLRPFIKESDPEWFIYRAYFQKQFDDSYSPSVSIGEKLFAPGKISRVEINGLIKFIYQVSESGIELTKEFLPSMESRTFLEKWSLRNNSKESIALRIGKNSNSTISYGNKGKFMLSVKTLSPESVILKPGETHKIKILYQAKIVDQENFENSDFYAERISFLDKMKSSLILETPDKHINQLFEFSKIRASESIFDSELGLIHSPGGGRYYGGIWANDQAEYVSPFFPYLGYRNGNISSINTFNAFMGKINPAYEPIQYAFEMAGTVPPFKLDRGDAAMIAYGGSQFALAYGDYDTAEKIWPLIEWCIEYCHKKLNEDGVVASESDEMEGRIETGTANLSTSSLYYGALEQAIYLRKSLNKSKKLLNQYKDRKSSLAFAIEQYFGRKVEGLETYRYYDGHKFLRHWICLPLVVGINERKEATVEALFERLWTKNGVHVEKNSKNEDISKIFWDRGTLYALRGTFLAGYTDKSLLKLKEFSDARLLGERVPYVVEAYPEGDMAHLSAESALYCRVITEGILGIKPTGLKSFLLSPKLPSGWDFLRLRNIKAFQSNFDIIIERYGSQLNISIKNSENGKTILNQSISNTGSINVQL